METWYYEVVNIDGDYANLKRTDIITDDVKLVARALLPAEINIGSKLKYEMMQYEIIYEEIIIWNGEILCQTKEEQNI